MKRIFIVMISFVLAFIVANFLAAALMALFFGVDFSAQDDPFGMFVVYTASFTLTVAILALLRRSLRLKMPSLKPELHRLNLPLIVLGVLALFAFGILLAPLLDLMPQSNLDGLYDMMSGGVWAIITGVVMAPILEEFLFRGVLQRSFIAHSNPIAGILLASLIFGAIHMIPQQVVMAFFSALVLGTIFYLTGSLATVIIIHMLNNGLAYISLIYLGVDDGLEDILFASSATFAVAYVVSAIFILGVGWWAVIRISVKHNASRQPRLGE